MLEFAPKSSLAHRLTSDKRVNHNTFVYNTIRKEI